MSGSGACTRALSAISGCSPHSSRGTLVSSSPQDVLAAEMTKWPPLWLANAEEDPQPLPPCQVSQREARTIPRQRTSERTQDTGGALVWCMTNTTRGI